METRRLEIIKTILYSALPISIEDLSIKFLVSHRTIKYDISYIRNELKNIKVELLNKKGVGYYISPEKKVTVFKHYAFSESEKTLKTDQVNLLLYTLFIENPAKVKSIANKLYFDTSTIKRYIENLNLKNESINLSLENDSLEVIGPEYEVRKFYVDLILNQVRESSGRKGDIQFIEAFPIYERDIKIKCFTHIENVLRAQLKKHEIWISKNSIEYLIVYLLVLQFRKNMSKTVKFDSVEDIISTEEEKHFAKEILKAISCINISDNEIFYLNKVMFENDVFSHTDLHNLVENKLTNVIREMIEEVNKIDSSLIINQEQLYNDLRPHLKQTIRKIKEDIKFEKNPLFHQVKQKYKGYYKIAQKIYYIFCKEFDVPYTDDGASLVAIYLYKNTSNEDHKSFKAYLICGTGRGFSKLLEQRLKNIFPNISILETLSSFYLLRKQNLHEVDIIISTIDLPELSVPFVKVSSFLGEKDIRLINQFLEYGTNIESISLKKDYYEIDYNYDGKVLSKSGLNQKQVATFSNIFLELYNVLVNLPQEYEVNHDILLGITIHLIIALPRYFEIDTLEQDEELIEEVIKIETKHKILSHAINLFLNKIEVELGVGIPYTERYAIYQYILN